MAEINKLDINGYTMESIYTKIGISYDRFVEILDRDFYTPTLETAPTSSTLTYTDTDGSVCEFRVGQFCRVVDDTATGGYRMYQCVDIQSGVGGTFVSWQDDIDSLRNTVLKSTRIPIVEHTEQTVEIQPNVYNKWGEVSSLTITLATPEDENSTNEYMLEFVSGATATMLTLPSDLYFVNGETPTIDANKTYQLSILNNSVVIAGFATTN